MKTKFTIGLLLIILCGVTIYFSYFYQDSFRKDQCKNDLSTSKSEKENHESDNTYEENEKEENPGVLQEAIRELKIAFDGTAYSPNYRMKELRKAKLRKQKIGMSIQTETIPWVERGPSNVSGRTQQLLVDPEDPSGNTWFAATVGGGVWKTTDGGQYWENKTPELTSISTTCIAIAESNHDVIYIGTGMGFGRVVDLAGNGLWKTTDHGKTWTQLESTANNELLAAINRIVVDPKDENIVLVCSNDDYTSFGPNGGERKSGIFRTTDGGSSWNQVYDPDIALGTETDNRIQQIIANPQNFNTLYATVNEVGVIKSTNAGLTWFLSADDFALPEDIGQNEGEYQGISTRTELAISSTDTSRLYAAVERPFGIADLFMTKNAGESWELVEDLGNDPNWFSGGGTSGALVYTGGWFDNTIIVSPYDENVVFVGGVEIYRIDINPANYTRNTNLIASTAQAHADHHDLKIIPVNKHTNQFKILNANDGGVALSNDGGNNWQQIRGIRSTQFYSIDKKGGTDEYIGGFQDNGTWRSGSNPLANSQWTRQLFGDGFEVAWNYSDPSLLIGTSQYGTYSRSNDGGNTWIPIPNAKAGSDAPFISKLASSDQDPDLVFTVGNAGLKRSDDFGDSWNLISLGTNWIGYRAFDNVEISIADPQIVWATSRLDLVSFIGKKGGIHVSNDGGLTFNEVSQNFPGNVTESSGFATHPSDPNTAYALFSAAGTPKILMTTDLGETWKDLSGFGLQGSNPNGSSNGFPDVATYSLLVMPYDDNILWAGTEIGLFISTDGGTSWNIADNGLPDVGIFNMFIQDAQIIVATYGRGLWTVNLPELMNYSPPKITLAPRLHDLVQLTSGNVSIKIDLRSSYDSTNIILNDQVFQTIKSNSSITSKEILVPVYEPTDLTASVVSFKNGRTYKTLTKSILVSPLTKIDTYANDFNSPSDFDDFSTDGFYLSTPSGFNNGAIHSVHPYWPQQEFVVQLKSSISVANENAIFKYDDIALIEPGIVEDFTDPNFFDFVVVEASKDGVNWLPLAPGYDARYDQVWLSTYNSGLVGNDSNTSGDPSMYRTHTINLLDKFSPGDAIFIRFRLLSDPLAVAWGWAIDNISIQSETTGIGSLANNKPVDFSLDQNYPNPFNPSTMIKYSLPAKAKVLLKIFDINGQEVITLVDRVEPSGIKTVIWNGVDGKGNNVSSGVYFYRIIAGSFVQTKKMILVK